MNVQLYLNVPYEQSARAKGMGARWDAQMRFWYVPHGLSINDFTEWWPVDLREQIAKLADPKDKKELAKLAKQNEPSLAQSMAHADSYKPQPAPHRVDLDVPFADKEQAKALGARWDSKHKRWYIEADKDMRKFARWISRREHQEATRLAPKQLTPEQQLQRDLEHANYMANQIAKENRQRNQRD